MEIDKDLDLKINEVLDSLNQLKEVKISNSFRNRVLNSIEETEVEENLVLNWFTPKLQLVAMAVVVLVNISAIMYSFSSASTETNISSFAQEYNLTATTTSITN